MKSKITLLVLIALAYNTFAQEGLKKGDIAPFFIATNQNGEKLELAKMLSNGPVVLVFYRGHWCPYCNKQLSSMQDSLRLITAKNATVIAVSPEKAESVNKTIGKTKASFNMVSDEGLQIMTKYKVDFDVDKKTLNKYKSYGINLAENNGANGPKLPVPATYVIGTDGKITYVYFDGDYRKRPTVKSIIEALN
jgi:peroxiredoxin